MAKAGRKRKTGTAARRIDAQMPPVEQQRDARFELVDVVDKLPGNVQVRIGKAYRRKPMIDTLAGQGVFSDAEHKALTHYRHHADIADRSPLRDSLNRQRGGNGTGPTVELLNATRVRDDCERAAGTLADILRAVVVDDMSLTAWAMRRGTAELAEHRAGDRVRPRDGAVTLARLDIQMAAKRVEAELNAGY